MPSDEPFHSSVSPNTISNAGIHFYIQRTSLEQALRSLRATFVCKVILKSEYIMKILTRIKWCNSFHNQIQSWDFLWEGPKYSPPTHDGWGDKWLQIVSKGTREWTVGVLYNCHDHKLNLGPLYESTQSRPPSHDDSSYDQRCTRRGGGGGGGGGQKELIIRNSVSTQEGIIFGQEEPSFLQQMFFNAVTCCSCIAIWDYI